MGQRDINHWREIDGLSSAAAVLWLDGVSTKQMAVELNHKFMGKGLVRQITKNAVVGWAHRNEMIARTSPIRIAVPKQKPLRLEDIGCQQPKRSHQKKPPADLATAPPVDPCVLAQPPPPPPVVVITTVFIPRVIDEARGCCYPFGDPRTSGYHTCGEPRLSCSNPYCRSHSTLCYSRLAR